MQKITFLAALVLLSGPLRAQDFEQLDHFPRPAANAFTVVGAGLPDGRYVVWNGDEVFVQQTANVEAFTSIARGYLGDPGFLVYEPSRNSVLLGAGFSGDIYRLSLDTPSDYSPAAVLMNIPHYSAVLLAEDLLLVDAGQPGFAGSELQIVPLGAKAPARVVVQGVPQKGAVVEKPPFTYSASLALDSQEGLVYSFSAFGTPEELRFFSVADLLNAYNTNTPLSWSADGTLVGAAGQFNNGGVAGVWQGRLLMPGFGSVQLVDPSLGNPANASIVDTFAPGGSATFYTVVFNETASQFVVVDSSGNAYAPAGAFASLPVAGLPVLVLLGLALAAAGRRGLR